MLVGDFEKERVLNRAPLHQINMRTEHILKPVQQAKIAARRASPAVALELHQKVHIAGEGVKVAARRRPKELQPEDAMLPRQFGNSRAVLLNKIQQSYQHTTARRRKHPGIPV